MVQRFAAYGRYQVCQHSDIPYRRHANENQACIYTAYLGFLSIIAPCVVILANSFTQDNVPARPPADPRDGSSLEWRMRMRSLSEVLPTGSLTVVR